MEDSGNSLRGYGAAPAQILRMKFHFAGGSDDGDLLNEQSDVT